SIENELAVGRDVACLSVRPASFSRMASCWMRTNRRWASSSVACGSNGVRGMSVQVLPAVDRLADDVGLAAVLGQLLDEVQEDGAVAHAVAAARRGEVGALQRVEHGVVVG